MLKLKAILKMTLKGYFNWPRNLIKYLDNEVDVEHDSSDSFFVFLNLFISFSMFVVSILIFLLIGTIFPLNINLLKFIICFIICMPASFSLGEALNNIFMLIFKKAKSSFKKNIGLEIKNQALIDENNRLKKEIEGLRDRLAKVEPESVLLRPSDNAGNNLLRPVTNTETNSDQLLRAVDKRS